MSAILGKDILFDLQKSSIEIAPIIPCFWLLIILLKLFLYYFL
jgi:hypothetical protein